MTAQPYAVLDTTLDNQNLPCTATKMLDTTVMVCDNKDCDGTHHFYSAMLLNR